MRVRPSLPALIALLLASAPALARRSHAPTIAPPPSPTPTPLPMLAIPDPPFVDQPNDVHPHSPEAQVFAAIRGSLCTVTATHAGEGSGIVQGTCFVVHPSGLLVTNNHVVNGSSDLAVRFADGRALPAHLAGADPAMDIAVLRVESDAPLPPALLGDSDTIAVGDEVLALGAPLGLGATLTRGILSGKERRVDVGAIGLGGSPVSWLQTDAAINPGCSGGPLVDIAGHVVGVITAVIPAAHGIAFAVPIDAVKKAMPAMLQEAGVGRAFLGLTLGPATAGGAEVVSIRPGGPADRAGFKTGDIVTSIRGREISSDADVAQAVRDLAVHETVAIRVERRGEPKTFEVTAIDVPVVVPPPASLTLGGAVLSEFGPSSDAAARSGQSTGVLFSSVPAGSPAERAGVKAGDVVVVVGMDSVADLDDIRIAMDQNEADAFKLFVRRGEKSLTLIVPR